MNFLIQLKFLFWNAPVFGLPSSNVRIRGAPQTICCHLIEPTAEQSTDPMAYDAACAQIATLLQATMQPNQRVIEEATAHLAQAETQPGAVPCSASPVPCALYWYHPAAIPESHCRSSLVRTLPDLSPPQATA